jgi:hypothetical protein
MDLHDQSLWVNKLMFPPSIKNKRMGPPMTDRLVALTKRVAELRQPVSRRATASKIFIFGGSAPSVTERY